MQWARTLQRAPWQHEGCGLSEVPHRPVLDSKYGWGSQVTPLGGHLQALALSGAALHGPGPTSPDTALS